MTYPRKVRNQAKELWLTGATYDDISAELSVSKGILSIWLRDVELPSEVLAKKVERTKKRLSQANKRRTTIEYPVTVPKSPSVTSLAGGLSELIVAARFAQLGSYPSRPFIEGLEYDLLVDTGYDIIKVQVRSVTPQDGALRVDLRRHDGSRHAVDAYAILDLDSNEVYFLWSDETLDKSVFYLRLRDTRSGQSNGINWAKDFVLSHERLNRGVA